MVSYQSTPPDASTPLPNSSFLEQCEPGLIFWLIEELLDSQTIDGCRKVFDYLESRRERNIKVSLSLPARKEIHLIV